RPMLPVRQHLQEDIETARRDSSQEDPWGQGESRRLAEIRRLRRISHRAAVALADSYVGMDYDVSLRVLDNLRDVMSLFGAIQGTKNLLLFSETLRLVPGEQYGGSGMNLTSVYPQLADVARQANEKNVRIY